MPKLNTTYSNTGPVNLSPNNKSVTCSHNDELSRTNSTLTNSIILARGQLSVIVYTPTVYAHANSLPYWLQMSYTTYPNPTQNYPTLTQTLTPHNTLTLTLIITLTQASVYAHANSLPYWLQMSYTTYPNPTQNYPTLTRTLTPHNNLTLIITLTQAPVYALSSVPQIILSWFNVNSMRRRSVCSRVPQINFS